MTDEREIHEAVDLCTADGRLNPAAIGWSRRPLQRANLHGRFPRKKRWNHWCVTCDECAVTVTFADVDYIGLAIIAFIDLRTRVTHEWVAVTPVGWRCGLPEFVIGTIDFDVPGFHLAMHDGPDGTRVSARARRPFGGSIDVDVLVAQPGNHESLNVVVPWSADHYQLTSKHAARPASGRVAVNGRKLEIGPHNGGFGSLDYGRGIWPYRSAWNWASASGAQGRHTVGLNLGGQWTDGTGSTENAIWLDGRISKISDDVVFEYDRGDFMRPWRIRAPESGRIDLTFTPCVRKDARLSLGIARTELHLCFGRFSGQVIDDSGEHIALDPLLGWAEEHTARW